MIFLFAGTSSTNAAEPQRPGGNSPSEALTNLLPSSQEVSPWTLVPNSTTFALQPGELEKVYGKSVGFFRDWKVVSAVAARYRHADIEAAITTAWISSPREALLLYSHQRQAARLMAKVTSLQIGQDAYWYEREGKLYAAAVRETLFASAELSTAGPVAKSALPLFLSAMIRNVPQGPMPFTLWVKDQLVRIDTPLVSDEGVAIPIKPVFDYLGYNSLWITKTLEAVFYRLPLQETPATPGAGGTSAKLPAMVKVKIHDRRGFSDDQPFDLEVAPFTFNGATYCSPDLFEKALSMKVRWDPTTRRLELGG
ncbi:MAG: hypothetical protein HY318_07420 [Armatimonadetes bacterium]|nr:hypothetical protein [Armatimonadota bacterium]